LKQAELARRIGVGRDSYNRYERSGTKPSLEVLTRIANELNTSTDYLLGNTDDPSPPGRNLLSKAVGERLSYKSSPLGIETVSIVAESQPVMYKTNSHHAVIELDKDELSLITDFRDIDDDSKIDLCRMAKMLAENARLKRMFKE